MSVSFAHITENEMYVVSPNAIMKELPYEDRLEFDKTNPETHREVLDYFRTHKISLYECTVVYVVALERMIGFFHLKKTCTWEIFALQILEAMHDAGILLTRRITELAYTNDPYFHMGKSKVLDTRNGTPYEMLPMFSVVNVCMGKTMDGWIPLVRHQSCFHCGNMMVRMKKCKQCKVAHYCSKECQIADWKMHKEKCK
jgi:hypothetical protein